MRNALIFIGLFIVIFSSIFGFMIHEEIKKIDYEVYISSHNFYNVGDTNIVNCEERYPGGVVYNSSHCRVKV